MNGILCISIFLISCIMRTIWTNNSTSSVQKRVTTTPRKPYRLPADESYRLRFLRSDIAQFLATYVQRETFRPTVHQRLNSPRKKKNKWWSRSTKLTTKAYYPNKKTYPTHWQRRDVIYAYLLSTFAENDEEKKEFLACDDSQRLSKSDKCYFEVYSFFMEHCFYGYFYDDQGMKLIKRLLSKACSAEWLDANKIIRVFRHCCHKRFKFVKFDRL